MKKNKNIITSKLLSEVLERKVKEGKGRIVINDNIVTFAYIDEDIWSDINIHELAHKCKEWAKKEGYSMQSGTLQTTKSWNIFVSKDFTCVSSETCFSDYKSNTEPEAIFKACKWILEQKGK